MRLRDDAFTDDAVRDPWPPRVSRGLMKDALAGIGDPWLRQAQDFLWSMGMDVPGLERTASARAAWHVGDEVEFEVPQSDGVRRAGRIHEINQRDAIVQVGAGEYAIIPLPCLGPVNPPARREAKRQDVRRALRGGGGLGSLSETRSLMPISETECAMTIQYRMGQAPSEDDVRTFVAARYPDARVVDGDDSHPGRLGLVVAFPSAQAAHAARTLSAQLSGPKSPPSSRMNATGIGSPEMPGDGNMVEGVHADVEVEGAKPPWMGDPRLHEHWQDRQYSETPEETAARDRARLRRQQPGTPSGQHRLQQPQVFDLEEPGSGPGTHNSAGDNGPLDTGAGGTGMALSASAQVLERIAGLNPSYDFVEGAIEESDGAVISQFAIERAGRALFVKGGKLTPVLSADAFPARGWIQASYDGLRTLTGIWLHGPNGPLFLEAVGLHESPRTAADSYQDGLGPMSTHENEPTDGLTYVVTADSGVQSPVATEEDGEHRESIGGPVHVAGPTEDYYKDYYGDDYGGMLVKDPPTREAEARVAMVRQAWADAGRAPPSADELLWALGVLVQTRNAHRHRTADAATPGLPGHPQQALSDQLIEQSANSSQAEQAVQKALAQYLSRLPDKQRGNVNPNDPAVVKKILPTVLSQMSPTQRQMLQSQFGQGGYKPDVGDRAMDVARGVGQWAKDKFRLPSTRRQQETQRSRQFNEKMNAPDPATLGGAPAGGAPAAEGGESLPAGTRIQTDKGEFILSAPAQAKPAGGAGGGQPGGQPAGQPQAPQAPANPANDPLGQGGVEEAPPGMLPPPAPPEDILQLTPEDEVDPSTPLGPERPQQPRRPAQPRQPAQPRMPAQPEAPLDLSQYDPDLTQTAPNGRSTQPSGQHAGPKSTEVAHMPPPQPPSKAQVFDYRKKGFVSSATGEAYDITYAQKTPADTYEGNNPPAKANLRMRMTDLVRRGDYLIMAVVWDAEASKKMAPGNVAQNLKSFVKQRATEKEFIDLGHIGKPVIEAMDLEAGIAEIRFRSSESRIAPPEYVKKEDASYHEPVR